MKNRLKYFVVAGIVLCFAVLALASTDADDGGVTRVESDTAVQESINGGDAATQEASDDAGEVREDAAYEAAFEITFQNAVTYVSGIGTVWVQAIFEVTNVGTVPLYLGTGAYDLEDAEGNLVSTSRLVSVFPTVLAPGERAVYHEATTLPDLDSAIDLTILPRPDVNRARIENVRLAVSEVSFSEAMFGGVMARGRVENTTDEVQSSTTVAVILYDADDNPIGVVSTTIMEDIAPGQRIGFEATALSLPPSVTVESVARYEAFAYPWLQIQW